MKVDFNLIKRYLDGSDSKEDKEKILEYFSDLSAEKELREKYLKYWNAEITNIEHVDGYNGEPGLDRIYHQMKLQELKTSKKKGIITRTFKILYRVAAVLFIPLAIFTLINKDQLISFNNKIAMTEIYAPLGTRSMFYLPDGSKGWLNGGSHLEFPVEFRGKNREVTLKGEAYFEVKENVKRPFIVSGNDFEVIVLGTVFNVLAYPEDTNVKVTTASGSVEVSGKRNEKIIQSGIIKSDQIFVYDRRSTYGRIEKVDASKIIAWKQGKLVFRNETFDEVVKKINRWYNVNLIIKDNVLKSHTYMATFQDENLDEVLKLLKLSAPIDYRDLGREIKDDGTFEKRNIEIYYNP